MENVLIDSNSIASPIVISVASTMDDPHLLDKSTLASLPSTYTAGGIEVVMW